MRCRGTTRSARGRGYGVGKGCDRPAAARSAPTPPPGRVPIVSRAARQQALRPEEHQHDEKAEGKDVAPFEVEIETGYRDDLGKQKGRDKPTYHVAEAAQHADQEGDRPESQADEGLHVILQYEQTSGEAGKRAANRRGDQIDTAAVYSHQRHDLAVLRDRPDRSAGV